MKTLVLKASPKKDGNTTFDRREPDERSSPET